LKVVEEMPNPSRRTVRTLLEDPVANQQQTPASNGSP
jgi:hypothetical protein